MATIPEYFAGQSVLITGATGFLGKVLAEKILRSCPDVKNLFLLVREKKGISPQERWKSITNVELFDKLKEVNPKALDKVIPINSDLSKSDLSLSDKDRQFLIENTTIIYHSAATVQFNNNMTDSIRENTRSTFTLLEMAKLMPNIKAFVYVSTTYCNFNNPETGWEEKVYPSFHDWKVLMKLTDKEEHTLCALQNKLLCGHPNTYTFSKQLAENVVAEYSDYFPISICRPAVVSGTTKDPFPSWSDSLNGLNGIACGAAFGILRVVHSSLESHQDFIPVDLASRALIAAPWRQHKEGYKPRLAVYNTTVGEVCKIPIMELFKYRNSDKFFIPKNAVLPSDDVKFVRSIHMFFLYGFFKMVLPFFFLDKILELTTGAKPRLIPILKKVYVATMLVKPFVNRKIIFPTNNFEKLISSLEPEDTDAFSPKTEINFNIPDELHKNYIGTMKYYFKEDVSEEAIKKNKERIKRISYAISFLNIVFYSVIAWIAKSFISSTQLWQFVSS